jgi:hypothetical protein
MRRMLRARLIVTLLGAAMLLPAPVVSAGTPSATGSAFVDLGDDILRILSFDATGHRDGSGKAIGHIDFQDPATIEEHDVDGTGEMVAESPNGVRMRAEVDCLYVEGNRAVLGGHVKTANVAQYVGKLVLLFVEDLGTGRETVKDRFSWGFYPVEAEIGCGSFPLAAFAPVDVEGGDFQVRP